MPAAAAAAAAPAPAPLRLLLVLLLLLPAALAGRVGPARAQAVAAPSDTPPLVAELSLHRVEITTGFTGASLLVFGSTERPIGGEDGEQVLVVAFGPPQPMVVRRKVKVLGLWVNGPSATFPWVPGFYAIAGTRPAWQILPEPERQGRMLGLDALPLLARGRQTPAFRAALLELKQASGLWVEDQTRVEISGGRLFHVRLPLPATVTPGEFRVEVLLVRDRAVAAREVLELEVVRVGTAAGIADVAEFAPLLYGLACIALAALAGWLGSVFFRRS